VRKEAPPPTDVVETAEEVGLQFYTEARRHKRNWASRNEKLVVGARSGLSDL